jgi:dienelactone hydrolase
MQKALSHSQPIGVASGATAPPHAAQTDRFPLAQRARALIRDDIRLFRVAAAVIAIAVADDAFVHPEPGTSAGDHLASGLIPIAIALLAMLAYPRLRAGVRGCIALVFGALALEAGIVDAVRHIMVNSISGDDVTGILAVLAGSGLLVLGAATLWRSRRLDERLSRRYLRRALETAIAIVVAVLVIVPIGMAVLATHLARAPVPAANLGADYRSVRFTTSDGLKLAGWYVPSRNGAAVIVAPGRSPSVQAHARMLSRHGYGVLVFDRRGEGQSQGDRNLYGWSGDKDLLAAVRYLRRQPDVHQGRIGGLGLSVGGEMLLQTAAETRGLKAVVSEGAGRRSLREHLHIPGLGAVQKWLTPWVVQTGALMVMSNTAPPPDLAHVVSHISPRPVLLIRALHGLDDESLNRVYYAHAEQPAALWEVPQGGHTGALAALPQQYEARVVGFFDRALRAADQRHRPGLRTHETEAP